MVDKLREAKEEERINGKFTEMEFKGDEIDVDMPKRSITSMFSVPAEDAKK